ncbi:MAG: hypothetical protein PHS86_02510 [Syntrophaceae bacterium]|nr:hypothetical protein [Syntrophaceae bacterium]
MRNSLVILFLLLSSVVAHAIERNCTISQDATAYYDSGNYRDMLYLRNSSLSAWSSRMARDVLEWRAKLIPTGATVDVVENQGDALVISFQGNKYYVMPDYVDCP